MKSLILAAIRLYQHLISPLVSKKIHCRFHPSCSEYAMLSINRYGTFKGLEKSWDRLKRCRPDNFQSCIDYP
jgi:putative membrane protein insertion efficiency factor